MLDVVQITCAKGEGVVEDQGQQGKINKYVCMLRECEFLINLIPPFFEPT